MGPAPDGANLARVPDIGARRCVRCGEPLTSPWWVTTWPHGEHERCRDWTGRPFPFERQVRGLRRLWRTMSGDARAELGRIGVALVALEARWPHEARDVLEEGRALIADARRVVVDLEPRLRGLL